MTPIVAAAMATFSPAPWSRSARRPVMSPPFAVSGVRYPRGAPRLSAAEHGAPGVLGVAAERLLDAQHLVLLGPPVRARRRAGFDLAAAGGHREVGDRRVLGLARAVAHDRR